MRTPQLASGSLGSHPPELQTLLYMYCASCTNVSRCTRNTLSKIFSCPSETRRWQASDESNDATTRWWVCAFENENKTRSTYIEGNKLTLVAHSNSSPQQCHQLIRPSLILLRILDGCEVAVRAKRRHTPTPPCKTRRTSTVGIWQDARDNRALTFSSGVSSHQRRQPAACSRPRGYLPSL